MSGTGIHALMYYPSNIFTVPVLKCPWQTPECSHPVHMAPLSTVTVTALS